ncbi:Hypothetical Protein RradSPS_0007 [Rubrobacter radiotolerans]|uniref:Uncharacterized protein n=1 Tax=Rubrobacter radiotolerans TaxID=42256 RepID=A0A023WZU5_RUBRA|nr:hypothetical protein [Rubrobacter radiotolerans]AHY45290.1 Hypothetical Protein RradSPS_0007 [Rubrobacter radiotolerans]MDX5892702.1 hypothetical protein [Rubrobacter radiotolerans]SMC02316.1 hypothetical protein SAMN00767673_0008 [Rubrobacter radiotolerans DSM 5868]
MESHENCEGVVECTALVLAESVAEFEGRLTLFGILDEIRPSADSETSFVVYAKFEGCEHATDQEWGARIVISDHEGEVLMESSDYSVWIEGPEEPYTVVAAFDLPESYFAGGERVIWVEAVLEDETLSQTAIRLRDRYNV